MENVSNLFVSFGTFKYPITVFFFLLILYDVVKEKVQTRNANLVNAGLSRLTF